MTRRKRPLPPKVRKTVNIILPDGRHTVRTVGEVLIPASIGKYRATFDKDGNRIAGIPLPHGRHTVQTIRNFPRDGDLTSEDTWPDGVRTVSIVREIPRADSVVDIPKIFWPHGSQSLSTTLSADGQVEKFEFRFVGPLGNVIFAREHPRVGMRIVTVRMTDASDAKEAVGSVLVQDVLRQFETKDAQKKRRQINTDNALKKQKQTYDQIRELWSEAREKGTKYYLFREKQKVSATTVDRAIPKNLRH